MAGVETLPSRIRGLPAMRLSFSVVVSTSADALAAVPDAAPGTPLGQIGRVTCPGAGSHAGFCATREIDITTKTNDRELRFHIRTASDENFAAMIAVEGAAMQIEMSRAAFMTWAGPVFVVSHPFRRKKRERWARSFMPA